MADAQVAFLLFGGLVWLVGVDEPGKDDHCFGLGVEALVDAAGPGPDGDGAGGECGEDGQEQHEHCCDHAFERCTL